jgi:ABC-type bacteriocin/lantibiotic exporter with double-glycine peptidase domain
MVHPAALKPRLVVPEVVQTSAMDCGPASLKAIFGGFGRYLSYGRLREACQTDVDGTSIDTLEEIAPRLGLAASQSMLPADLLLRREFGALPAIVVQRLADGATHFVVLWAVHGGLVQVMDPAAGRVWMPRRRFLESLYRHEQAVPRADWEAWAASAPFQESLAARAQALGVRTTSIEWPDVPVHDAALRLAGTLREAGQLARGGDAQRFLERCAAKPDDIPAQCFAARAIPGEDDAVLLGGAVVLTVDGSPAEASDEPLPDSLAAVLHEPAPRAWAPVLATLREAGWRFHAAVGGALVAASVAGVFEVLLFRGLMDLSRHLATGLQRTVAMTALMGFLAVLLALEWPTQRAIQRLGTRLEVRLRAQLLQRMPRLEDRYFQSRLVSDMASRAHSLQLLHGLPDLLAWLVRLTSTLLVTGLAITALFPGAAAWPWVAVASASLLPLLFLPALFERDLRVREHAASMSRFYLEAMLGLRALQAHDALPTLRAAHEHQVRHWTRSSLRLQSLLVQAETLQSWVTLGAIVALVFTQLARAQPASLLLLVFWAMQTLQLGQQTSRIVSRLPGLRTTLLRLLELLHSPVSEPAAATEPPGEAARIELAGVDVVVAGRSVLQDVSLRASPGEHIAIVGRSGAGKSSLLGLLLGWYTPAAGTLHVDGAPIDAAVLAQLRARTTWIDPQVHLFDATLFENLCYGNGDAAASRVGRAIEQADLAPLLGRSQEGLQLSLGENGSLVSGGEGQRVRIARALGREAPRLALLDEPARGLDRSAREAFLATARRHFAGSTMFYVTHDIAHTLGFDRVLVVEDGRIREQGPPAVLAARPGSRYRQLLDLETTAARELWSGSAWRRLRMSEGRLVEEAA